jgi:L-methionine (R)-S-oxide reductase
MSFTTNIPQGLSKTDKYKQLLSDATHLVDEQVDIIANMANLSRLIFDYFSHHWVGFYRVNDDQLVLGPFQGPIACTTIKFGQGVCGKAWQEGETQLVADVHQFPGHIACSALSNSEIVVPCFKNGELFAVLDIDSEHFNQFDSTDRKYLEQLVSLL